ncbi:PAS domain S-box protein [Mucilaginibacter sp.]|uniref:PAS domain S-box protein n=1 Tax=Mucilaginibacter sp. TaxID=1882438 RepID=UPI003D13DCB5
MDSTLSFLFEQSNDFFCVLDRNGIIVYTNPALQKLLGYTAAELNGKKANSLSHPADIKNREEALKSIFLLKKIDGRESRIKDKAGVYYNIRWSLILNPEDGLIYTTGINLTNSLETAVQKNTTDNIYHIIQSFNEGFLIIDDQSTIITFNPAFQAITGLKSEQLKNTNLWDLESLGVTDDIMAQFKAAFKQPGSTQLQYFNSYTKRWLRVNTYPYKNEVAIFVRDINALKIQQLILALEKHVLELNASANYTLPQTIHELISGIETIFPDMVCSVLEVDEAQEKVYHLSGPRLPNEYCVAIDGTPIGPKAGSCGTAAYHRTQIVVKDIETDPLWDNYRHLILPYGLKACWSTPIISANSAQVLATFAVYYKTRREPKPEELRMIERTSNIIRILIENKRSQDHVTDQNMRLQEIASISSHEIRRPVATIMGLVNLFDLNYIENPMNKEIISHLDFTARELDSVIHTIVEKTVYLKSGVFRMEGND